MRAERAVIRWRLDTRPLSVRQARSRILQPRGEKTLHLPLQVRVRIWAISRNSNCGSRGGATLFTAFKYRVPIDESWPHRVPGTGPAGVPRSWQGRLRNEQRCSK